jgi:hypothetical protein
VNQIKIAIKEYLFVAEESLKDEALYNIREAIELCLDDEENGPPSPKNTLTDQLTKTKIKIAVHAP